MKNNNNNNIFLKKKKTSTQTYKLQPYMQTNNY